MNLPPNVDVMDGHYVAIAMLTATDGCFTPLGANKLASMTVARVFLTSLHSFQPGYLCRYLCRQA
jgi:hypothetical protein